ncbi:MAG TPA: hypothetical protein VD993_08695 [Chitinophagaceae bacterium]|nr:hypothetical protein [Chitinophagaceae bacterium]
MGLAYLVTILLIVAELLIGCFIIYYAILSFVPRLDRETRAGITGVLSIATVIVYMVARSVLARSYHFYIFGGLAGICYAIIRVKRWYAGLPPFTSEQEYESSAERKLLVNGALFCIAGIIQAFLFVKLVEWLAFKALEDFLPD